MPKSLENEENADQLARRLIAELAAARQKKGDSSHLAEYGRQANKNLNSGIITPRLTQQSSA